MLQTTDFRLQTTVTTLAEGHIELDQKIDRVAQELSKKMDVGFADVLAAVRTIAKQLQEHERAHTT